MNILATVDKLCTRRSQETSINHGNIFLFRDLCIWINGPQGTNPNYLKNAKSEHLIG